MRDTKLKELRPQLNLSVADSTDIEAFQSETLRPILKLQHEGTYSMLMNSAHFNKLIAKIDSTDHKAYEEKVRTYIASNVIFRSKLLGMILGMMTSEELKFYYANASEVGKRIVSMQIERFVSVRDVSAEV